MAVKIKKRKNIWIFFFFREYTIFRSFFFILFSREDCSYKKQKKKEYMDFGFLSLENFFSFFSFFSLFFLLFFFLLFPLSIFLSFFLFFLQKESREDCYDYARRFIDLSSPFYSRYEKNRESWLRKIEEEGIFGFWIFSIRREHNGKFLNETRRFSEILVECLRIFSSPNYTEYLTFE